MKLKAELKVENEEQGSKNNVDTWEDDAKIEPCETFFVLSILQKLPHQVWTPRIVTIINFSQNKNFSYLY